MAQLPPITLRYFDCRGRAQHFRFFLRHRNIPYTDERVPLSADFSAWKALQPDRARSGYFQKLPVLHWGDEMVAETSVIHHWLHQQSGDERRLSARDNLRHEMLASSCYVDLMLPLGMLIWAEVTAPGADLSKIAAATLGRVRGHLAILERTLDEWGWWEQLKRRDLMITDCLLWETLSKTQQTFGAGMQLESYPRLNEFHLHCGGQPLFAAMLAEHPRQLTGRPGEAEAIQRIRAALAGAAAL
jgi:glutathione S-transferase